MPAVPKKSSTVILIRDTSDIGFEVLLLKRHDNSNFMGGNYVYPGGKVDAGDSDAEMSSAGMGISPVKSSILFEDLLTVEECLAHRVAAIRELFEESGILMAYKSSGDLFYPEDDDERQRFNLYRNSLHNGKLDLAEILNRENLTLAFDQLSYYAHWITPEAGSLRFDARFFIACLPEGQEAAHDDKETTDSVWLTPARALDENLNGEVFLSPPTLKILEDLSRFKTRDEVFSSLKDKEIKPILPVLIKSEDFHVIIFPWDREFGLFKSGKIPDPIDHGRPSEPYDNTTRVLLTKGRWLPYSHID